MNYALLASGNLGLVCLKFLHQHRPLNFVFTDKASVDVAHFCTTQSIPCFLGNPRGNATRDFLGSFETDVLFSTNYLFLVEHDVLSHPSRFAINFHGSLLPKYRGRAPHIWAIINGEKQAGVTAHMMDSNCDTGDIVLQQRVAIDSFDSGASILNKYESIFPEMVNRVVEMIESNAIHPVPQDHSQATYFPKRTPTDGEIDWCWPCDRIRDWVRALRHPYPGAFAFVGEHKIVVQNIRRSSMAFDSEQKNGSILSRSPLTVQAADGALEITDYSETAQVRKAQTD